MAEIYHTEADPDGNPPMVYWDRTYYSNFELQVKTLQKSSTLYVGNLSFYTQETQIHELFSKVAPVKLITMGVNKATKTPCGFCFVEYYLPEDAGKCIKYISGTACDDRLIRTELDAGFKPGRQFGRGKSGGQVRDERRQEFDPGRGGLPPQPMVFQQRELYRNDGFRHDMFRNEGFRREGYRQEGYRNDWHGREGHKNSRESSYLVSLNTALSTARASTRPPSDSQSYKRRRESDPTHRRSNYDSRATGTAPRTDEVDDTEQPSKRRRREREPDEDNDEADEAEAENEHDTQAAQGAQMASDVIEPSHVDQ